MATFNGTTIREFNGALVLNDVADAVGYSRVNMRKRVQNSFPGPLASNGTQMAVAYPADIKKAMAGSNKKKAPEFSAWLDGMYLDQDLIEDPYNHAIGSEDASVVVRTMDDQLFDFGGHRPGDNAGRASEA